MSVIAFLVVIVLVFVLGLSATGLYAYWYGIPFADTYTYLDPGRHLIRGHGFVTTFNVVHGWSGRLEYPGLAYYNPLYGIVLAVLWELLGNAGQVNVVANAVPCCLNAVLIGLLAWRAFGPLTAMLSAVGYLLLPSTWQGLALIAAEHPAVTVILLCLLVIQRYAPTNRYGWLVAGLILGVGALVKVTVLLILPGVLAALILARRGQWVERLRTSVAPVTLLGLGVAGILVPFSLLCRVMVGEFYPAYPSMAKNWSLASQYGGHYVAGSPAVQPDVGRLPTSWQRLAFAFDNALTFLKFAAREIGLLLIVVVVPLVLARGEGRQLAVLLVCVGASLGLGHALSFNWLPLASEPSSPARYVLYVVAFWYPVALYGLVQAVEVGVRSSSVRAAVVIPLWLLLALPGVRESASLMLQAQKVKEPRFVGLQRLMTEGAKLVRTDDLVAVAGGGLSICAAVFLDRPVVALPQGRMDTPDAMREFIQIFHPALIIPASSRSAPVVLPHMGYQLERASALGGRAVYLRR